MEKLKIDAGRQLDGCTFRLNPQSKALISNNFPDVYPPSSLFISYEDHHSIEQFYGSMWWQIAMILTGLTEQQIKKLYEVVIVDPVNGTEIFNSSEQNVGA